MNNRSRFLLPLGAALLLGAAVVVHFLLSGPVASAPAGTSPAPTGSPAAGSTAVSTPGAVRTQRAGPAKSEPDVVASEGRSATVVPLGPGDVVPEPEVENAPPQRNDPIEPEKPQTAEWKHGKLVRISELMARNVERLEEERAAAEANGDKEEAKRLAVQLSRHRARLEMLNKQTAALAGQASQERAAQ
ncbi:MAG TPA: hypothetical protein VFZ09_27045 [Archangium sp.]|uniref:hypothetical protein n=1 Tax=Archangium sp. TaxID=1872627 RepID=UPI002E34EF0E|nr:hypothetical protein [Archangium sp.]HEX5749917.1 hypothetical protein [Archangium sp.]